MIPKKVHRKLRWKFQTERRPSDIKEEIDEVHRILDELGVPRSVGKGVDLSADARLRMMLDMECNLSERRTS